MLLLAVLWRSESSWTSASSSWCMVERSQSLWVTELAVSNVIVQCFHFMNPDVRLPHRCGAAVGAKPGTPETVGSSASSPVWPHCVHQDGCPAFTADAERRRNSSGCTGRNVAVPALPFHSAQRRAGGSSQMAKYARETHHSRCAGTWTATTAPQSSADGSARSRDGTALTENAEGGCACGSAPGRGPERPAPVRRAPARQRQRPVRSGQPTVRR